MSHNNMEGFSKIYDPLLEMGVRFGVMKQALGATLAVTNKMPPLLVLDPGASGREVDLPALEKGLFFIIVNAATGSTNLTVKESTGTTTVLTIDGSGTQTLQQAGIVFCDGTQWWGLVAATT